ESRKVAALPCNEKVLSDDVIALRCAKQPWRLIEWLSPEGTVPTLLEEPSPSLENNLGASVRSIHSGTRPACVALSSAAAQL
ncbi:MAG: hypothetical protein P8179_16230, partial [Candidatus Thiodiazotropha sp.]